MAEPGFVLDFPSNEKAVYSLSGDTRRNLFDINDPTIKEQATRVACLVESENLILENESYKLKTKSLKAAIQDKFKLNNVAVAFENEPALGFGTAFLVGSNRVLTAAHCVCHRSSNQLDSRRISLTKLVFGFQMKTAEDWDKAIEKKYVYGISQVLNRKWEDKKCDWALLELDRNVEGFEPLKVDFTNSVNTAHKIYMLGHPYGIPMKLVDNAEIKPALTGDSRGQAQITAFAGNSGSPIFSAETHKVIAILVAGNPDYSLDQGSIKDHVVTEQEIQAAGYEKLQMARAIEDDLVSLVDSEQAKNRKRIDEVCNKVLTNVNKGNVQDLNAVKEELGSLSKLNFLPAYHLLAQIYSQFHPEQEEVIAFYLKKSMGFIWPHRQLKPGETSSAFSIVSNNSLLIALGEQGGANATYAKVSNLAELDVQAKGTGASDAKYAEVTDRSTSLNYAGPEGKSNSSRSITAVDSLSATSSNPTQEQKNDVAKKVAEQQERIKKQKEEYYQSQKK